MKILVPVKQVQALEEDALLDGVSIDPDAGEWDLNEWDSFSLEAALQISESVLDTEVVVVTVGSPEAEEGLLSCLARGADRGIAVNCDGIADLDSLAVAQVLAAIARRESPDLVLCGVQSSQRAQGATGVALSGLLDLAHVAVVNRIEVEGETLTVQRELEGGVLEAMRLSIPALLTVQTGTNEPRYATLRAIKQARSKPLESLTLADLGLSAAAMEQARGARLRSLARREAQRSASMLDGGPQEIAAQILDIVREAVV